MHSRDRRLLNVEDAFATNDTKQFGLYNRGDVLLRFTTPTLKSQ